MEAFTLFNSNLNIIIMNMKNQTIISHNYINIEIYGCPDETIKLNAIKHNAIMIL